jgi:hypothetical protein
MVEGCEVVKMQKSSDMYQLQYSSECKEHKK